MCNKNWLDHRLVDIFCLKNELVYRKRILPGILDESCDESADEGGGELATDRVQEMSGHLDEVPEPRLALGVGEVANLIRGN